MAAGSSERVVLWHRVVPGADSHPQWLAGWSRRLDEAVEAHGGQVAASAKSQVVALFDPVDLEHAIGLGLTVLATAEKEGHAGKVCFSCVLDTVLPAEGPDGKPNGPAVQRAELLAGRAKAGELVLDANAREMASNTFLFGRHVGTGPAAMRGQAIDRRYPRRERCRPAIQHLKPVPIPDAVRQELSSVIELAQSKGQGRLLLRAPIGAGSREWVDALERELEPPLVLRVEGVPGSVEPLGSLRFAMLRKYGSPGQLAVALDEIDAKVCATLVGAAAGHAAEREAVIDALKALLRAHQSRSGGPWIVLDPLSFVDAATVEVVASATEEADFDCLLLARLPVGARPPTPLLRGPPLEEIPLPTLRPADASFVAQGVLGEATADSVARRVSVLGGDTPLGVAEAARAFISAGDLVFDRGKFTWRVHPRRGITSIPVETFVEERLASLEQGPLKVLEAVCAAPSGSPRSLIIHVARADGVSQAGLRDAIARLEQEAMLQRGEPWQATSLLLRNVVVQSMPPARSSELYRFVAAAMAELNDGAATFAKATLGYFLAEGGQDVEGAQAMLEAGRAASLSGFERAAVRLAAAAVQSDGSGGTRQAATMLSRATMIMERARVPESAGSMRDTIIMPAVRPMAEQTEDDTLQARIVGALLANDFEAVDRCIDIAIAEGKDRAAAERLRAMGHLARGDLMRAERWLARSFAHDNSEGTKRRGSVARSVMLLRAGRGSVALRAALGSLASSRKHKDAHGEAASLRALAQCYRLAGRADDAKTLSS